MNIVDFNPNDCKWYWCAYNFDNPKCSYNEWVKMSLKFLYKKKNLKSFGKWVSIQDDLVHKNIRGFYKDMPYLIVIKYSIFDFPFKFARIDVGFRVKRKEKSFLRKGKQ